MGERRVYEKDKQIKNAIKRLKSLGMEVLYSEFTKIEVVNKRTQTI